ncbi:MAG: hypothetical protein CMA56_03520 [Euryarchaeota archaeon]|nr:hypothetical protein [Euryarchaeota archaeon]|tara:strand:+ start:2311 stop:2934 length:624 start_codon:yes stop_codon:yes gene_type:complete
MRALVFAMLLMTTTLAGCVTPEPMLGEPTEPTTPSDATPERMTIVAPTAGRSVDEGDILDVVASANGNATLLIWVAAGCSGCHDWTEMVATAREEGNYTDLRVVSVHRYPSFEDADEVIDRYGTVNTSTEATWPLLLPNDGDTVVNADTGEATAVDLVDAFQGPVTPTLQVLDGEGHLVWTSKTYWSNDSVLEDAAALMRSLNEASA